MNPLVSVIIPTYNGEKFLPYALSGVLGQTYDNIEIIIINDGSTDGTEKVILEFQKKDPRIMYFKNEHNTGFVKSLNSGIDKAHGEYIARVDDDDAWIDIKKLDKQVSFLEKNQNYVLVGGGLIIINRLRKEVAGYLFPQRDEDIRSAILVDNIFAHSSVVFRKNAFLKVGGYDERFGFFADRELWLKLGTIGKFYNFPEHFMYYLDKEEDTPNYNSRNDHIRRKLKLNIELRRRYRRDYPGFYKSLIICAASYIYSYLPYRQKFRWIIFRVRVLIFGRPPYTYIKSSLKDKAESIAKKTVQGTFWLFSFRIVDHSFRLVRTIILARLLAPNDFGLFGITVMAVSLLETFSQNGFQQALTQKKGNIVPYLDSAWVVQIARGLVLALVLFFLAPFIALFFNAPASEPILKVVALAVALQGFYNIAIVYFSKELQFHKYFLYQIVGTLADFTVSVTLAFMFRSVWALVFGLLAGTVARLVLSYLAYSYIPRFSFNAQKAKELFVFGKWVFITNIIAFFITQADGFFVAKMLGVTSLGFYQIAYKIPSILAIDILAGAIFPAYAKIQDNLDQIKQAYLKILRLFAFFLLPAAGGLLAIAPEFIKLFLGEKWLPAASAMQVLIGSTLVWTIAVLSNYVFLALAKPEIEAKGSAIRFLVLAVLLYPLITWWGIFGASVAVLASALCSAAWFVFMVTKLIHCQWKDFLSNGFSPLINTLCMMALVFFVKGILPLTLGNFLLLVLAGAFAYTALTYIADRFFKQGMIPLIKETMHTFIK